MAVDAYTYDNLSPPNNRHFPTKDTASQRWNPSSPRLRRRKSDKDSRDSAGCVSAHVPGQDRVKLSGPKCEG